MKTRLLACFYIWLVVASPVLAGFIQIASQSRSLLTSNSVGDNDSSSLSRFGLFNQSLASTPWNGYSVTASQDSVVTSRRISAQGSTDGGGPFLYTPYDSYTESSSSSITIEFKIFGSCRLVLNGTLGVAADVGGTNYEIPHAGIDLSGKSGSIFSLDLANMIYQHGSGSYQQQLNETFFLSPGLYTFNAFASTDGHYSRYGDAPGTGGGGQGSFSVNLTATRGRPFGAAILPEQHDYHSMTLIPESGTFLVLGLGALFLRTRCCRAFPGKTI